MGNIISTFFQPTQRVLDCDQHLFDSLAATNTSIKHMDSKSTSDLEDSTVASTSLGAPANEERNGIRSSHPMSHKGRRLSASRTSALGLDIVRGNPSSVSADVHSEFHPNIRTGRAKMATGDELGVLSGSAVDATRSDLVVDQGSQVAEKDDTTKQSAAHQDITTPSAGVSLRGGGGGDDDLEEGEIMDEGNLSIEEEPSSEHVRFDSTTESTSDKENEEVHVATTKRKRQLEDEARGTSAKTARFYSPFRSSSASIAAKECPKGSLKRKRAGDNAEGSLPKISRRRSPTMPTKEHESKRKRSAADEEHGALAKAAQTYSPVNSSDIGYSDEAASSPVLKRKRRPEDEEHGALAKAPRTYSPVNSSDIGNSDEATSSPTLKRKRSLDDNQHGALSKAARTYSPVHSSELNDSDRYSPEYNAPPSRSSAHTSKKRKHATKMNSLVDTDSDTDDAACVSPIKRPRHNSPPPRTSGQPSKKRGYISGNGEEDGEVKRLSKKPRTTGPTTQNSTDASNTEGTRKRRLPWQEPDYPYYTKRARYPVLTERSYPKTEPYDGLRYTHTDENSPVEWNSRFGVLLGELTHLTVPKAPPVHGWGNNADGTKSRHKKKGGRTPLWALPPRPPPVEPIRSLTKKQQHEKDKAKARKEAKKPLKPPPKVEVKKEVNERFLIYARFNHRMRFVLRIVPMTTTISTEYRSTNPDMTKENKTKGIVPVVTMTGRTEKVKFGKQTRVPIDQFDIYLSLGRVAWMEKWKQVFEDGNEFAFLEEEEGANANEDVGEKVREMGGMMAVMRMIMASPPPDANIQRRIRCFHATGKFGNESRMKD